MQKRFLFLALLVFGLVSVQRVAAAGPDIKSIICHKWKVIWFSDDGVVRNMESKKQQLILKPDGTGTMHMMGELVGNVTWVEAGKMKIKFSDDPNAPPYLVKISKYKNGVNMLFTGRMPNGVTRKVYFSILSGNP